MFVYVCVCFLSEYKLPNHISTPSSVYLYIVIRTDNHSHIHRHMYIFHARVCVCVCAFVFVCRCRPAYLHVRMISWVLASRVFVCICVHLLLYMGFEYGCVCGSHFSAILDYWDFSICVLTSNIYRMLILLFDGLSNSSKFLVQTVVYPLAYIHISYKRISLPPSFSLYQPPFLSPSLFLSPISLSLILSFPLSPPFFSILAFSYTFILAHLPCTPCFHTISIIFACEI